MRAVRTQLIEKTRGQLVTCSMNVVLLSFHLDDLRYCLSCNIIWTASNPRRYHNVRNVSKNYSQLLNADNFVSIENVQQENADS